MEYAYMTDEMESLFNDAYDAYDNRDYSDWNGIQQKESELFDRFSSISNDARERNELLGRTFSKGVADGKAFYMVIEVMPGIDKVQVALFPQGDGYFDETISDLDDLLPINVVEKWVTQEEGIRDIFSSSNNRVAQLKKNAEQLRQLENSDNK